MTYCSADGQNYDLTVIPEPVTGVLLGLAGAVALMSRRFGKIRKDPKDYLKKEQPQPAKYNAA